MFPLLAILLFPCVWLAQSKGSTAPVPSRSAQGLDFHWYPKGWRLDSSLAAATDEEPSGQYWDDAQWWTSDEMTRKHEMKGQACHRQDIVIANVRYWICIYVYWISCQSLYNSGCAEIIPFRMLFPQKIDLLLLSAIVAPHKLKVTCVAGVTILFLTHWLHVSCSSVLPSFLLWVLTHESTSSKAYQQQHLPTWFT